MQLIHSITLTTLVVVGATSAFFHHSEKPYRDVAAASALLCAVSATKLADPGYAEQIKAISKGIWGYMSIFQ